MQAEQDTSRVFCNAVQNFNCIAPILSEEAANVERQWCSVDQVQFGANFVAMAGNPENQVITALMRDAQTATQNDDVRGTKHHNSWTFEFDPRGGRTYQMYLVKLCKLRWCLL